MSVLCIIYFFEMLNAVALDGSPETNITAPKRPYNCKLKVSPAFKFTVVFLVKESVPIAGFIALSGSSVPFKSILEDTKSGVVKKTSYSSS